MDNVRLKELAKVNPKDMDDKTQQEFIRLFKEATFLIPIDLDENISDFTVEDIGKEFTSEDPVRFAPVIARQENGESFFPLFTDSDEADEFQCENFLSINCEGLAALIVQSDGVDVIVLNPNGEGSIAMSTESFLELVMSKKVSEIDDMVKKFGKPVSSETRFYLRESEPRMKRLAKDGVLTSDIPFNVNFQDEFCEDKPYVNIIIVPKGTWFLYVGDAGSDWDSLLAPTISFKLIEEDGNTFTWKCTSQKLNHDIKPSRNKLIYLVIAIVIVVAVISFLIL